MVKIMELKKPKSNRSLTIKKNKDGNYVVSYTEILNKNNEKRAIEIARTILSLQYQGWKEKICPRKK